MTQPQALAESYKAQAPIAEARERSFSGLDHERDLNYDAAIVSYRDEIAKLEVQHGEFDLNLFPKLLGLARSLHQTGDIEAALDAAQRAQHITHRHYGVHNLQQIEVLDLLTLIHLGQDAPLVADKQQKFAFYIRESNVEPDSIELLPALEKLGQWYEQTGQLHRARRLNEQSIEIVEAHFGEDTTKQLPYLQKLAKLKRLQRVCCSTRIMKQALAVVEANPDIDDATKARTYVEIGDAYTIAGDHDKAETFYQQAWNLMPQSQRLEHFASPRKIAFSRPLNASTSSTLRVYRPDRDPFAERHYRRLMDEEVRELESLPPQEFVLNTESASYDIRIRDRTLRDNYDRDPAVRTVGKPYAFLHKQLLQIVPSSQKSDAALEKMRVEIVFDIDKTGRPINIEIVSAAAPGKVKSLMREVVRKSRFRPRMENGFTIGTSQYRITQSFAAKKTNNTETI